MRRCSIVIIIALLLTTAACHAPKPLEYRGIDHFGVRNLGVSQSTVTMDVHFYNPNKYDLELKGGDVAIYMNDKFLGKTGLNSTVSVPAMADGTVPISIQASLQSILTNALQLITNPEVTLKMEGSVKAGRNGIFVNVPINYVTKQRIEIK